jgi:hypothetical protein
MGVFVGMPQSLALEEFGTKVWDAFGHMSYLVGSCMERKDWRDIDVRLILPDEVWEEMGLGDPKMTHSNAKWCALVQAFSALAKQMTGLPVDFQIQQQTYANATYQGVRSALYAARQNHKESC